MLETSQGLRRSLALVEKIGTTVDAALCTSPENIYFFTGFRTMLYTRFTAALVRVDQPADPILVAASVDRRLVLGRLWSPPWVSRVVYHGPDSFSDVSPTPSLALAPHFTGVRRLGVDSLKLGCPFPSQCRRGKAHTFHAWFFAGSESQDSNEEEYGPEII